ncbi:MAG: hypothetical protein ACTSPI_08465 [Candidatus Heimdallarchaeaceae archaeon]
MTKSCIYYTDNRLDPKMLEVCQKQLRKAFKGEIVSCSLKPMDFGRNIVLKNRVRSYPTMITQILMALEAATTDYVFFTEHDVLYHPSHFNFTPPRDDIYYYNINNWRWRWKTDVAITYDSLHSLSGLCCNRELAIKHYKYRIKVMKDQHLDENRAREPRWARLFGYEPGTKKKRRGGITNEDFEVWKSKYPNVDIRHKGTFSHPKTFLREFKHLPKTWVETTIDKIEGWDLKKLFNL